VRSIRRCRELLDSKCSKTDAEIEQLRDDMMALADIALDLLRDNKFKIITDEEQMEISERASIMEFDGHMQGPDAENKAREIWLRQKPEQKGHPVN
jgi:hypothetical protein